MKFVPIVINICQCFFFGSTMLYKITQMLLKLHIYIHTNRWKAFKEQALLEKWARKELKVSPGSKIRFGFDSSHISSVSLQAYAYRHIFMLPLRLD